MSARDRRRRARRLSAAAGVVLVAAGAAHAAGDGTGRFFLDTTACPEVSGAAVRRLVAIEVGDLLREERAGGELDRLAIRCDGGGARVAASSASSARVVARELALRDFPGDAAPRALALAGLEALAALNPTVRARIERRQAASVPVAPGVVSSPVSAATTADYRPFQWGLALVARKFFATNGVAAWGGRLEAAWALGARGHLALDLEVARAETALPLGEASALLGSFGALAGLSAGGPRLMGLFLLGARGGIVRLSGAPTEGTPVVGTAVHRPWAGPVVSARALVGLGPMALALSAEAGLAARGAEGLVEGETVIALAGGWIAAAAGIVF